MSTTTIKIVGENWCPFTKQQAAADPNGAWDEMNADGSKTSTYEDCRDTEGALVEAANEAACTGTWTTHTISYSKVDCANAGDDQSLCDGANGYPSFMDSKGATCTRGYDRTKGFDNADGINEKIKTAIGNGTCSVDDVDDA